MPAVVCDGKLNTIIQRVKPSVVKIGAGRTVTGDKYVILLKPELVVGREFLHKVLGAKNGADGRIKRQVIFIIKNAEAAFKVFIRAQRDKIIVHLAEKVIERNAGLRKFPVV